MRFDRPKTIEVLKYYRAIDKSVAFNERIISDLEYTYYPGITSKENDGMPQAQGWKTSQVESAVLNVPQTVQQTLLDLKRQNQVLKVMKREIFRELNSLDYIHRVIVMSYYIEERNWEWIASHINYSTRQCRNIRNVALDRLAFKFSKNKYISRCRF